MLIDSITYTRMPSKAPPLKAPPPVERKSASEAMAEAAARPLDFDVSERSATLKENLLRIVALQDEGKTVNEIRAELPEFVEKFPEVFKKVTTPGADLTPLLGMMEMLDKMGTGQITHHNASIVVGQALAAKFMPAHLQPQAQQQQPNL
jgi:hypothetical protein